MKKKIFLALALAIIAVGAQAMSASKIRNHARYLTDRMAYELDFTPMQYDDCYEINYDFIYSIANIMDDVVRGYYDAINTYYRYLDYRNEDLRYIMTANQYIRFLSKDYFYCPVYSTGSSWAFRVYTIYSNRSFFYFDPPRSFKSYRGGHSRTYYDKGYYGNRYASGNRYTGRGNILGSNNFNDHRKNDFGTNLRDRIMKPDYNNYNNRNSSNRTADPRYRDNSGNQNAPLINNRTNSGEHRGAPSPGAAQGKPATPQTPAAKGTTTGTRSGNSTPASSTRGNRSTGR